MEGKVSSGENGDWYIFRARDLVSFVSEKMGPPVPTAVTFRGREEHCFGS